MSYFDRLSSAAQSLRDHQYAAQDAAINKGSSFVNNASSFINRLPSAAQSLRDHQYAAQDAAIERGKDNGVSGILGLDLFDTDGDQGTPRYKTPVDSAWSVAGSPVSPQELKYINADLAEYYGMDVETAYQEALANTAFRREVKDMKAAGLNPAVIYGGGRGGSGADSFRGTSAASGGSGGSGGGYSRRSGKSNSGKNLFTVGQYYGISTAVGIATAVLTENPANYWLGSSAAQGVLTAISGGWNSRK